MPGDAHTAAEANLLPMLEDLRPAGISNDAWSRISNECLEKSIPSKLTQEIAQRGIPSVLLLTFATRGARCGAEAGVPGLIAGSLVGGVLGLLVARKASTVLTGRLADAFAGNAEQCVNQEVKELRAGQQ